VSISVPPPDRCKAQGPADGYHIGDAPPHPSGDLGADAEAMRLAPFAVELGGATRFSGGFAVGVKHHGQQGLRSAVAVLDGRGAQGRLVDVGPARGDMDAPLVVASGDDLIVGVLEPNASGLSVRLARVVGSKLTPGAELSQGRDESLAFDMEFGDKVGVVAWDDVVDDPARSVVLVATVARESLEGGENAKIVSGAGVDAELPRVVTRPGGFWLAYVGRAVVDEDDKSKLATGRYAAERIDPTWIELVPLDEQGVAISNPRAVTAKDGHVLAYDLERGRDGGAIIAWRDDDTPSGAHGGSVTTMLVNASGAGQTQTVADEHVGSGVPNLLSGWIAVPTDTGRLALAPMSDEGELIGTPRGETLLGIGQLLAVGPDGLLLLARPSGKSVDLITVTCARSE